MIQLPKFGTIIIPNFNYAELRTHHTSNDTAYTNPLNFTQYKYLFISLNIRWSRDLRGDFGRLLVLVEPALHQRRQRRQGLGAGGDGAPDRLAAHLPAPSSSAEATLT